MENKMFSSLDERIEFFERCVVPIVGEACAERMVRNGFLRAPASKGHHSNFSSKILLTSCVFHG